MAAKEVLPEPMMKRQYEHHLLAEGIEPFYLPAERRAHAFGATVMLTITAKTVISALQEASNR